MIVANATVDSSVTVRKTSPVIEKGTTVVNITDLMFYLFSFLKIFGLFCLVACDLSNDTRYVIVHSH